MSGLTSACSARGEIRPSTVAPRSGPTAISPTTAGSDRRIAIRPHTAAATRITPTASRKSVATVTSHSKALPPRVISAPAHGQTQAFVEHLAAARIGRTYNQYADSSLRRARLAGYPGG